MLSASRAAFALCVGLAALKASGQEPPDPWLAADEALGRSGREAALALAAEEQGPDVERLRAYLAEAPVQAELRQAYERARTLAGARKFREALDALDAFELDRGTVIEARAWDLRARLHRALGAGDDELAALRRWRAVVERLGWLRGQRAALARESGFLQVNLRYEEQAEVNGRQAEVEERLGNPKGMHGHRLDRAAWLVELGRLREAIRTLSPSLEAAAANGWTDLEAPARDNLATALWKQGDYAGALREVELAGGLWRGLTEPEHQANNAMLKATIQQDLGDFEAAEEALEGVRKRIAANPDGFHAFFHAAVKGNLGGVAWRRGRHDRALVLLAEAREGFAEYEDRKNCANASKDLAEVLIDAGRPADALPHLEAALNDFGTDPVARAETLALQAEAHLRAGHTDRAAAAVAAALSIEDGERDRRTRNRLYEVQARILLAKDRPGEAVAVLRKAMDLVDDVVAGLSDEETFSARAQRARLFQAAVECAFRSEKAAAILEFLERGRATALREAMGNRRTMQRAALPADLADALDVAGQEVVETRMQLLRALQGSAAAKVAEARAALDAAEERLRAAANRAEREHKRLAGVTQTRPATLAELQEALRPGEALVYYALAGERVRAFRVTAGEARPFALGDAAAVRTLCARARDAFLGGDAPPLDELREALVAPLGLAKDAARVMVCPDGPLAYLPWVELLGDLCGSVVPSGTTFVLLRAHRPGRGKGTLAFGAPDHRAAALPAERTAARGVRLVPLPKAREEIEAIAGAGEGNRVFLGKQATEAAVRAALGGGTRWRAVHFACHGIVDQRFPRRSALALTPADGDDGFLTIPEIMALDVPADLAVLSACNSGGGEFVRGEGVVGLARAFMAAGAPCVVASLWKADDAATKDLMVGFYRGLESGLPAARSLRAAQRAVAAQPRWAHARFWAGWVVLGLPDA